MELVIEITLYVVLVASGFALGLTFPRFKRKKRKIEKRKTLIIQFKNGDDIKLSKIVNSYDEEIELYSKIMDWFCNWKKKYFSFETSEGRTILDRCKIIYILEQYE